MAWLIVLFEWVRVMYEFHASEALLTLGCAPLAGKPVAVLKQVISCSCCQIWDDFFPRCGIISDKTVQPELFIVNKKWKLLHHEVTQHLNSESRQFYKKDFMAQWKRENLMPLLVIMVQREKSLIGWKMLNVQVKDDRYSFGLCLPLRLSPFEIFFWDFFF